MTTLSGPQVAAHELADWSLLLGGLHTRLLTADYATGLRLVALIGAAAQAADHHPDLDLRYGHLDIRLASHDVQAVTGRDVALARTISALAADLGVRAAPDATQRVELALDTPDGAAVLPFWQAVLAMSPGRVGNDDADLRDDVLPSLWFQRSGTEPGRQRFHLDLWITPEAAPVRIAAALAAGGVLVSDAKAPAFWVLADAEGNRVCLCTWQDREPI